jgi:hypothetical protein
MIELMSLYIENEAREQMNAKSSDTASIQLSRARLNLLALLAPSDVRLPTLIQEP